MQVLSISTATYYEGDAPVEFFTQKTAEIIEKNPWLCGRLKQSSQYGLHVEYPDAAAAREAADGYLHILDEMEIDKASRYDHLVEKICGSYFVKKGVDCVDKPDEPLFSVCLMKVKGKEDFAFVLCLSHVIGDGHTFYRLHSMYDKDAAVIGLNAVRDPKFVEKLDAVMGEEQVSIFTSTSLLMGMISTAIVCGVPKAHVCSIDLDKIKARKDEYAAELQAMSEAKRDAARKMGFLSTNDIVSGEVFKLKNGNTKAMAINMRGRVDGITNDMAGNYEQVYFYATDEDASPEGIRRSVSTYKSTSNSIPSGWKRFFTGCFGMTTWATFYEDVHLPDGRSPLLHLPIIKVEGMAVFVRFGIIFHPTKDKLGMIYFTRSDDVSGYHLGDVVSTMDQFSTSS